MGLTMNRSFRELWNRHWVLTVWLIYAILLLTVAFHHEPWADEAQAWLMVRDLSLPDLLFHHLRFEGHPSVWYLALYLPVKLGLPYRFIFLIPCAIAMMGVWIFLRHSPFPFYLKILFPFTYFVFYQYGLIARNYVLLPLCLFWVAVVFRNRHDKPFLFILALIVLANTTLHGTIMAIAVAAFAGYRVLFSDTRISPEQRTRMAAALVIFLVTLLLLWLQLKWPQGLVYTVGTVDKDPVAIMNYSLVAIGILSLPIWGLILVYLARRQVLLLYVIGLTGLLILMSMVFKVWHEGVLFLFLVFVLWLAMDQTEDHDNPEPWAERFLRISVMVGVGLMFCVHIIWNVQASRFDLSASYSGSGECARYLKESGLAEQPLFMVGFNGIGVLPYFDRNIFVNHNSDVDFTFWWWSTRNFPIHYHLEPELTGYLDWIQTENPRMILFGLNEERSERLLKALLATRPYTITRQFSGETRWKGIQFEADTLVLLERKVK